MINRGLPLAVAAGVALSAMTLSPPPADAAFGDHALRTGDTGREVRVLQRWLGVVGFPTPTDGLFGARTAAAVRVYEGAHSLRVDGRVSPPQARGLRKRAYAARASAAPAPAPAPAGSSPAIVAAPGDQGDQATLAADGRTAVAPASAPEAVKAIIAAANEIVDRPYRYGGGHGSFEDRGYDCSGAVSYALHGAGLLTSPLDSSGLTRFGDTGGGRWVTVFAHGSHAYVVVAGLRFDTSGRGEKGPRWRPEARSPARYAMRHPAGL